MYQILIADDSSISLKGMQANIDFKKLGAELAGSFMSGNDVLKYLADGHTADLLISDIRMPNMTGLELAQRILKHCPMMKIIFISAYDDFEYACQALKLDAVDYVQKPIRYEILTTAIRKALEVIEEDMKIRRRLEDALPEMRRFFFRDLVHTPPMLAHMHMQTRAEELGISTGEGAYLCMDIVLENGMDSWSCDQLLKQETLMDQLERTLTGRIDYWSFRDREQIVCIFHGEDGDTLLQKVLSMMEDYKSSHPESEIYIGIGRIVTSFWDLSLSMEVAENALSRRYIHPDQSIFCSTENSNPDISIWGEMYEWQNELLNRVLKGDTEGFHQVIMKLTDILMQQMDGKLLVPSVTVICGGLLSQIRQPEIKLDEVEKLLNIFSRKPHVNVHELNDFLFLFFDQMKEIVEQSRKSAKQDLVNLARNYVHEHISDEGLHVENIARALHVSSSHLSRCFKTCAGNSLNEYITSIRIEMAKQELERTDKSVQEISKDVGYSSPYYFSACFKKMTGKSPTDFRNLR